ncbi:type II toxin-antitoxin system Phd/YefM family antitoxin [Devosia sp. A8/3-2]|nr:type II toxin-antitoxin system Phd/YefM family antitoxin [Devosia sp. A8/3-2]
MNRHITRTMSSREFNQNTSGAKLAANDGPVIITDRGKAAYVLMTNEEFERLNGKPKSPAETIADTRPEADFDYDFPRLPSLHRPFEFPDD